MKRAGKNMASSLAGALLCVCFATAHASIAFAQEPAGQGPAEFAEIPGDIFGFTDAAGIDKVGSHGIGVTTDGTFGKRTGSYGELATKYSYGRVIAERTSLEVALFTAYHSIANVATSPIARNGLTFNGASFELAYQLVQRSANNPFAVKVAVEPRWSRIDGDGRNARAYGAEFKFIVDAPLPVISDRLFWAANIVLGIERARVAGTLLEATGSSLKFSTGLAYEINKSFFLGMEATYVRDYAGFIGAFSGHSLYLGPTILFKLSENATLSGTIAPQIAGKASGTPGRLDLDGGARYIARVKFGYSF